MPTRRPSRPKSNGLFRGFVELQARERQYLLQEIVQIKGAMPLLMKRRNQGRWTREDKTELRRHLVRLSRISPYLVTLALPGSFVLLPALAWWLDRRRNSAARQV